jgi:hypothetical protein
MSRAITEAEEQVSPGGAMSEESPLERINPTTAESWTPQENAVPVQATSATDDQPSRRWPKSWPVKLWYGLCFTLEWLFGLASLLGCLSVLAAIPIFNLITLGYLLEASGRVATSGRLRDGFIDIAKFARIGSMVAGTWLCLLVPRFVASLASDAWLIDPDGFATRGWRLAQIGCTLVVIGHILLAWYSGGRLRHFFWPLLAPFQLTARVLFGGIIGPILRPMIRSISPNLADDLYVKQPLAAWFPPAILLAGLHHGRMLAEARDAVWDFTTSLRLPQHFWLGLRGFIGALAWLLVPSLMLMAGTSGRGPATVFLGFVGALALGCIVLHLPFLQTNFACRNRLAAMFDVREVWRLFIRAPIAYWFALAITLLFALPLYLLKIEPVLPHELQWTITIFFILFIYPARLLTGWAVGRAMHRDKPRFFLLGLLSCPAAIPVVFIYVFILFFTQYTSFLGPASILEQHAFLVPVPFLSL